ncbi:MAG: hypothetical protein JW787_12330 [Sedimentisphaerales bacterium]|nr:hypothetical protein [Sedimentisphaerales bacterium]
MQFQLDRDPNNEFALVSGISSPLIYDICESARNSNGNPEDYFEYQIKNIGADRRGFYQKYCENLNFVQDKKADREKAFDYLKRTYLYVWPDDQNSYEELLGFTSLLVNGEPHNVISCLADYAIESIRKCLYSKDIWDHLCDLGFEPRKFGYGKRIAPTINSLQQRFEESIAPGLIANQLISRDETQELLKAVDEECIVILHGTAGYGKSGVLYELTQIFKQQKRPYLAIRLDRQELKNTAKEFGQNMGLPESPVLCLDSLINEKTGVLILDQLDALRWTSSHSSNSLEVCKDIVREVMDLRRTGRPISVVLSCRTFDLEHDQEIKKWLENQYGMQTKKIKVNNLSEDALKNIIKQTGHNYDEFSIKQRQILTSAIHLALWVTITKDGTTSNFQSGTQLMREFWKNRFQELDQRNISIDIVEEVLDILINYMEENGKIFAPEILISTKQKISTELQTLGLIRIDNKQVTFCHQSYLDFRIADRLLREIHQRKGRIKNWLGDKEKQSLFRREQLRQTLLLLSDDSPSEFLSNIQELLESDEIRFHLKHLILEVIGQIENPVQGLCDYLLNLYLDDYWKDHIKQTVFLGQPQYIKLLLEKGLITAALDSESEKIINSALWLLHSVNNKTPDSIVKVLSLYIEKGENWPQRVLNALCWNPKDDSEAMFELRLQLARMQKVTDYCLRGELAKTHPMRVIKLIEAIISTWNTPKLKENSLSNRGRQSRLEQWGAEDVQAFKLIASNHARDAWALLMPHIERLSNIKCDKYDENLNDWTDRNHYVLGNGRAPISRGIVEMLCEAGKKLASDDPEYFLEKVKEHQNSDSYIIQEILIYSYASLPPKFADEAIKYLLEDINRLDLGTGYREPEWMPAVRLIQSQSPHCSEEIFIKLEYILTHYHPLEEIETFKYCIKEGYLATQLGKAKYILLPALCEKRRSSDTNGLIGVLKRKYDKYDQDYFLKGGRSTGGFVSSPLVHDRLSKLSDNTWLEIITNKKITNNGFHRWKQIGPDHVAEASVRNFANDIRVISKRFPVRFAKLALKFPQDIDPSYISAILDGIKTTKPQDIPEEEKSSWEPAKIEVIEAILEKFPLSNENNIAQSFCWLIRERAEEDWSNSVIDRLIDYAINHPDLETGKLNVLCDISSDEATIDDLEQNAINCVRGNAASAIGKLLWEHSDFIDKLKPALEHLVADEHPAVRVAALQACMSLLNTDKDLAVNLFQQACKDDLRVASCRYAVYYFNSCLKSHTEQLSPIIINMLNSKKEKIAEKGAEEVCAQWLSFGFFVNEVNICKSGSTAQRKGIAHIASIFILKEQYTEKCKELLLSLFNDEDSEVRQKARETFFNKVDILNLPDIQPFILSFIQSQAFRDDPTGILYTFEYCTQSLITFADSVFKICEEFAGPLAEISRDISRGIAHDVTEITTLLLRLYEQSKESWPDISSKCLDMWDILFEHRIGNTRDLTKEIEQ